MANHLILGSAIFIFVFIFIQPFGVPGNIFSMFGAFTYSHIFGFWPGLIFMYILNVFCMMSGIELSFYVSRYFLKECIQK